MNIYFDRWINALVTFDIDRQKERQIDRKIDRKIDRQID